MLENGNLEGGFRYYNNQGELETGVSWIPWYYEIDGQHRPEYKPHTEDAYVHSGGYSQKMFTTWASHQAGMYQLVDVTEGGWYQFSAWVKCRTGETTDKYPYMLAVGANPYGASPTTPIDRLNNQLGRPSWQLGIWHQLSVTFQAWAPTVCVFTFGLAKYGLQYNDSYWDDMKLKRVTQGEPNPDPDPPPTPVEGCQFNQEEFAAAVQLLAGKLDTLTADMRNSLRAELNNTAIHVILSQSV